MIRRVNPKIAAALVALTPNALDIAILEFKLCYIQLNHSASPLFRFTAFRRKLSVKCFITERKRIIAEFVSVYFDSPQI